MPKCVDCGYLQVRDEYQKDKTSEADDFVRQTGQHSSSVQTTTRANVFCWMKKRVFTNQELAGHSSVKKALEREIECDAWTEHWPGRDGKAHEDMDTIAQVRRLNEEFQANQLKLMADSTVAADRRHDKQLEWQREVERGNQKQFMMNLAVSIAGLLVAIVAAVVAIYAAVNKQS